MPAAVTTYSPAVVVHPREFVAENVELLDYVQEFIAPDISPDQLVSVRALPVLDLIAAQAGRAVPAQFDQFPIAELITAGYLTRDRDQLVMTEQGWDFLNAVADQHPARLLG